MGSYIRRVLGDDVFSLAGLFLFAGLVTVVLLLEEGYVAVVGQGGLPNEGHGVLQLFRHSTSEGVAFGSFIVLEFSDDVREHCVVACEVVFPMTVVLELLAGGGFGV